MLENKSKYKIYNMAIQLGEKPQKYKHVNFEYRTCVTKVSSSLAHVGKMKRKALQ